MIRLCESCWRLLTRGRLEHLRLKESCLPYKHGEECAFLHVLEADKTLRAYGRAVKR